MKYINILIIDRDKSNIYKMKMFFNNNQNIKIFQAQNIKESLMIVIKNKIDLIVYDFQMPHLNCSEITKILQKNSTNKNISFVFVGYSFENEFNRVYKENNINYISFTIKN